jgi:DNA polymerase sigma
MIEPISGTTLEIVCNTALPLFSTRLVKSYNSLVPTGELRDCILLAKHWARQHDLLGSGAGELSGYAWTLLCIFYCQACLRLMPSLQGLSAERQQWTDPFGSNRRCDVGFADEKSVPEALLPDGVSLFIGFIDFYANYWNWKSGVISVRLGKAVMVESAEVFIKQPAIERSNALIIEDPFDIKKDICIGSLDRLRNQIMETAMLLTEYASLVDIMGPLRRRQQRTDSAF